MMKKILIPFRDKLINKFNLKSFNQILFIEEIITKVYQLGYKNGFKEPKNNEEICCTKIISKGE